MEETLSGFFASAPFLVSFAAGVVTFISPCVLPLIPAYISYISGMSVKRLSSASEVSRAERLHIFYAALMFVLGFSIVFVLLGAAMAELIKDIFNYAWIGWIAGGVIVLFGLHMAGFITIRFLNFEQRANFGNTKSKSFFGPFVLGLSFALGWTPCVGPIFAAIVFKAAQDPSTSIWLLVVYAAGLAVPFLLTAILTSFMLKFLTKIKRHFRVIEIVAGLFLVVLGVAIATGGVGKITALFIGE
ncbi:MAG TPA: cytochrome c biogenesis protein CcdA [Campylobacterales bacterium]|nr:cytochrome c biogenesis protein CcdA [Campylobacterales bacterium]